MASLSVSTGAASAGAGKSVSCASTAAGYTCLAYGMNANAIGNGVVAVVNVGLAANATTASINIGNALGASLSGGLIPVAATGGIIVVPVPALSSVTCDPGSLGPLALSVCTVSLNAPAGNSGAIVALSSSSASLAVPASVAIAPGQAVGIFAVGSTKFSSDTTATITATLNGASARVSVPLIAPVAPSLVTCGAASLAPGSGTFCTVLLSKVAPAGGVSVSLSSSNAVVTVPASVSVAANATSASFAALDGNFLSAQSAVITASLNGSSVSASLALSISSMSLKSLQCLPGTLAPELPSVCAVAVSNPSGLVAIAVSSDNALLQVPAQPVVLPDGNSRAYFTVTAGGFTSSQTANVTATLNGSFAAASIALALPSSALSPAVTGAVPGGGDAIANAALACDPAVIQAGQSSVCELRLASPGASGDMELPVSADSGHLRTPASIAIRSGQRQARFEIAAGAESNGEKATVGVRSGADTVQSSVTLAPSDAPLLDVPGPQTGRPGAAIHFRVRRLGSTGASVLTTSGLPAGAAFDSAAGVFDWVPNAHDLGVYRVTFTASGSGGLSTSRTVPLTIGSGLPQIESLQNAAGPSGLAGCVPGSAVRLAGSFLAAAPRESRVFVNGEPAAVLRASSSQIDFICPAAAYGTELAIEVQTPAGKSQPLRTTMQAAAPGILGVGRAEKNQAAAFLGNSGRLAAVPTFEVAGAPAMAGDALSVLVTGVVCGDETLSRRVVLQFGAEAIPVDTIAPSGHPGICRITATVPGGVADDRVPLSLSLIGGDGVRIASNRSYIAVAQ